MAHDVFVSHSSKDKPTADAVCAMLESQGIRCWVAPRDIMPGMDWGEAIVDAVKGARVMVLIFSASANSSPQIKREVERAVSKGIPVIPLRIEDVAPTASLEYFISTPHWLDAFTPPLENHLKYLAQIIRQILGPVRTADIAGPKAAGSTSEKGSLTEAPAQNLSQSTGPAIRRSRPLVGVVAVAIVFFAVLALGWWFGIERPRRQDAQRLMARLAEEQIERTKAVEKAKRAEEESAAAAAAAKAADEKRAAELVIQREVERQNELARIREELKKRQEEEESQRKEKEKAIPSVPPVVTNPPVDPSPDQGSARTNLVITTPPTHSPPPPIPPKRGPAAAFELIKEANRSLGEESKDRIFYARSERSPFEWLPGTWRIGFYDPAATWKVIEPRFMAGEKVGVSYPAAILERYNPQKVLDRKKLNIDSDKALEIVAKEPALAKRTLKGSEMKLEVMSGNPGMPVWTIRIWLERLRNPGQSGDIGEIVIAADDGKVIRRNYDVNRAN